ncbi:hypothetical protein Ahy_B04g069717 isoform B [Arachis hypogaea]|uniref:Uncharacterized protein n=1 Tax=Arachis hypogaea TaxID=3818 RepID=A0A444ZDB8_ARAHY|nr:hypothetical protein Ahy_B04g069717 isoform B [Arachis hypogaea]
MGHQLLSYFTDWSCPMSISIG